jgi:hypothetical protein
MDSSLLTVQQIVLSPVGFMTGTWSGECRGRWLLLFWGKRIDDQPRQVQCVSGSVGLGLWQSPLECAERRARKWVRRFYEHGG